jgi:hypothetical protein
LAKDPASQDDRASQKPRRKPVTIDLPAAEVGRKPGEAASSEPAPAPEAVAPAFASAPEKSGAAEPPSVAPDRASPPPKGSERVAPADPVTPSAFAPRNAEPKGAWKTATSESASAEHPAARGGRTRSFVAFLFAALVGGAIAAVIIIALARAGYLLPASDDNTADATSSDIAALKSEIASLKTSGDALAPLKEQIAALQKSVGELSQRAPASSLDPAQLKDLQDRLAAIESAPRPAGSPTNLEPRIAALAQDIAALKSAAPPDTASLQSDIAALRQQLDALSASVEKLPQEERFVAIEAKLSETDTKLGEIAAKVDETAKRIDNAAALAPAVAADALQAALDSGRPFQNELAALKSLGVDAAATDALASQDQTGLPTIADLRARFEQAIASIPLETPIPENTGAIDRLLQSAQSLVSVRPAHPVAGNEPGAIVARIRGALAAGDLKSALVEWDTLPDTIKTPTAEWAKLAKARVAVDDLVAEVRSAALSKLSAGK